MSITFPIETNKRFVFLSHKHTIPDFSINDMVKTYASNLQVSTIIDSNNDATNTEKSTTTVNAYLV